MDVVIQRGRKVKLEELPQYSIALDGFVPGPKVDPENHRFSFDHHEGCLRYCTTSACMQTWTAILLGLDPSEYTIYANDVDSDVCIAVWCLKNPDRCQDPLVKKLVDAVGLGDMHGGAFPFPNNGLAKTVEWISAPETDSKRNNDYNKLSDGGLYSIMEAVLHRIDLYADGEASIEVAKQPKHGEYKILRNQNDWVLIESQDPRAFSAVYHAGFDRIVLTRPQSDGSLAVSIAKKSDFVGKFNIPGMFVKLNRIEPGWGGGSTIGGAPRNPDGSRSRLKIEAIIEVIDSCCD
jgi:hypothetical protein